MSEPSIPAPPAREQLLARLETVKDPDLGYSIVKLGMVYDVSVADGQVTVTMTLTTPTCPYGPQLVRQVHDVLAAEPGIRTVVVNLVWDPPWTPELLSDEMRLELGIDW